MILIPKPKHFTPAVFHPCRPYPTALVVGIPTILLNDQLTNMKMHKTHLTKSWISLTVFGKNVRIGVFRTVSP